MSRKAANLAGRTFTRLTVLERSGAYVNAKSQYKEAMWLCKCTCGNTRRIRASGLLSGHYKSCGCLKRDSSATIGPRLGQFKRKPGTLQRSVFQHYQIRALRKALDFSLSFDLFMALAAQPCVYCGTEAGNLEESSYDQFRYNGLDRLDNSKGYMLENVVPCCGWCNIAKFNLSGEDFIKHCEKVTEHNHD